MNINIHRVRHWIAIGLGGWGLLIAAVTFTPLCYWWASALSMSWNEPDGDILVVMAGDVLSDGTIGVTSYWRSVYTVRAWKAGHFKRVILTGDPRTVQPMRSYLLWSDIPASAVESEVQSQNTHESAVHVGQLLRNETARITLLTSDYHMYRSWHALMKEGVRSATNPFPDARKRVNKLSERWPIFCQLVGESSGIVYYKLKGWI